MISVSLFLSILKSKTVVSTLTFKCLDCNKNYEQESDEGLTKRFKNKYWICNIQVFVIDIDKFCLMLWKSVYPYENIDSWERHHYHQRNNFVITLKWRDNKCWLQTCQKGTRRFQNTNSRSISWSILAEWCTTTTLTWEICLKKTKVEPELITDVDMLLMIKKVSKVEWIMPYIGMQKPMINAWKTRIIVLHVLGCQQSLWIGNVIKCAYRWFEMEKLQV